MSYCKLSKALPFPFYKSPKGLFWSNIRQWEFKSPYHQKWVRSDTTKLQCESSIPPMDLKIYDVRSLALVKSIAWVPVFVSPSYSIYELNFDISDRPQGLYILYQQTSLLAINWEYYSEPISSKDKWPETILHEYWHDFNDYDVAWTTGVHFKFRVEAGIMDPNAERDRTAFMNQVKRVETLMATPYDTYKLYIGEGWKGVPYWTIRILNFIWACHHIYLTGDYYHETGYWQSLTDAKWELTRVKGFPKFGAGLEVIPADNSMSVEYNDGGNKLAEGIVTAYNIETDWFGKKGITPVIDIENNS
jgi:hypothetical protein